MRTPQERTDMEAAVRYFHACPVASFFFLQWLGTADSVEQAQRPGERHRFEFDGEGLPQAVSVPVDWCPWTARH